MYEAPNSAERFAAREKMKQSVDVCKSSSLHGQGLMASSGLLILIGALLFFPYGIYEVRAWLKKNDEKAAKPQP
jgi:hypothetical protein